MYKRAYAIFLIGFMSVASAFAANVEGLIKKQSPYSVTETLDRLEAILTKKGITVVARWKHSDKAHAVDIKMRDTQLLIFGNPRLGSHLMTSQQTMAIDLPMKAIAWKDESGQVWLAYNDPYYMANRHGVTNRDKILTKMSGALNKLTDKAISK